MSFALPATRGTAMPSFADARSCSQWLQDLPLINVGPAHGRLLGEIEELNSFEMPPGERIKVIEVLREPVLFVQSELARKFSGKAVPLAPLEREIFLNVLALWDALCGGWLRCLQHLEEGQSNLSGQAALICQRALWSTGLKLAEHYKVYQEISGAEWGQINRIFVIADRLGVTGKSVPSPLGAAAPEVDCAQTFAQIQLLALANPNEHAPRQQAHIARWLERWARKIVLSKAPIEDATGTPLSVDLEVEQCASRAHKDGAALIHIGTGEIHCSLTRRITALKQGEPPESLGLGADISVGVAAQMLVMLHQQWCEHRTARRTPRQGSTAHAQLCAGMASMHYFITGRPFESQENTSSLTRQQREHIETFGQLPTRTADEYAGSRGFSLEHWQIVDESSSGFRLERRRDGGNGRFLHNQLIAVRPADANFFTMCSIRWISIAGNAAVRIGTRAMPGVPQGIGVRIAGLNARVEKFVPGMLLPAMPALRSESTLLLPAGWYRPKRLIELHGAPIQQVTLTAAVDRGSDFDRCTFSPA